MHLLEQSRNSIDASLSNVGSMVRGILAFVTACEYVAWELEDMGITYIVIP